MPSGFAAPAGTLRFVHTSDTHLGHQQYGRTDAEGLNQREQDGYAAWHATIDHAIAANVDLFVHAGDLFDGVRPSNRALAHALEGFLRLSRAGIPAVVIAGNHEHPKLRETGSPFRLFEHLSGIHPVYKGERETFRFGEGPAQVWVHAVPQVMDHEELARQIGAIQPGPGKNILVVHGAVNTLKAFSHAEFNELTLDPSWFDGRFDYVALGHFHGLQEVTPRAWYCGAPERVSIAEAGQQKGFLEVRLDANQGGPAGVDFRALPVRPYADLPVLDASGLTNDDIVASAKAALARVPGMAVARLRIANIDPTLKSGLDLRSIQAAGKHALHLEVRTDWADGEHAVRGSAEFASLAEEFDRFAAQVPLEGLDRRRLVALAREVLGGTA